MTNCGNLNHNKMNVNVRFCVTCGEIVNRNIKVRRCSDAVHSQSRKTGSIFCTDCGKKLVN